MVRRVLAVDPGYSTGGYVLAEVADDGAMRCLRWGCWRERKVKAGFETVATSWQPLGGRECNGAGRAVEGPVWSLTEALADVLQAAGDPGTVVVVEGIRVYGTATAAGALVVAQAAGAAMEALGVARRDVQRPTWAQWTAVAVGGKATEAMVRAVVPPTVVEQVEASVGNAQARQAVYDAWGMAVWAARGGG